MRLADGAEGCFLGLIVLRSPYEVPRLLYVPFFLCRVGLSYLSCRRFNEGAPNHGSLSKFRSGLRLTELLSAIT